MNVTDKRIQKEFTILHQTPIDNVTIQLKDNNLREWQCFVGVPQSMSPFSNHTFEIIIKFPTNYPFDKPQVQFATRMFHPNIDSDGGVCIDTLKGIWQPSNTIKNVLLEIIAVLITPNTTEPLVPEIANLYMHDYKEYVRLAKKYIQKYAMTSQ